MAPLINLLLIVVFEDKSLKIGTKNVKDLQGFILLDETFGRQKDSVHEKAAIIVKVRFKSLIYNVIIKRCRKNRWKKLLKICFQHSQNSGKKITENPRKILKS